MSPGESQQRHQLSGVDRFRRYRREGFSAQATFTAGRLTSVDRFWRYRRKGSAIWSLGKATAFALSRPTIGEGDTRAVLYGDITTINRQAGHPARGGQQQGTQSGCGGE